MMSIRFNNDSKELSGLVLLKLGLVLGRCGPFLPPDLTRSIPVCVYLQTRAVLLAGARSLPAMRCWGSSCGQAVPGEGVQDAYLSISHLSQSVTFNFKSS